MNVTIEEPWEGFVQRVVKEGSYGSVAEVVSEGLPLIELREAKLAALRTALATSSNAGGCLDDAEIGTALADAGAELRRRGIGE